MDNSTQEETKSNLINSFMEITSSTKEEALFFLESHRWDLGAAVSTFLDDATAPAAAVASQPDAFNLPAVSSSSPSLSHQSPYSSPSASLSRSPSSSRSPSPAPARDSFQLPSRRRPERKENKRAAGLGHLLISIGLLLVAPVVMTMSHSSIIPLVRRG